MRFGFYSKNDSQREIINSGVFKNSEDAAIFFAALKGLDVETFLSLFEITTIAK